MEIIELRAQNFLTLSDSGWLSLASRGLNLIQGENADDTSAHSNGAGKSSVPDALLWALYGTTARGESGDAVVNHLAKKNCQVTVILRDGESLYSINRFRKDVAHKNSTLFAVCDEPAGIALKKRTTAEAAALGWTDLSRGTERETQAAIERVLGCSYEVFMAAIYAGQEQMPDLPAMTDKQLKALIEEAAGVERLAQAYDTARAKLLESEKSRDAVKSKLAFVTAQIARERLDLEAAQAKHAEFEAARPTRSAAHSAAAANADTEASVMLADIRRFDTAALFAEREQLQAQLGIEKEARRLAEAHRLNTVDPAQAAVTRQQTVLATLAGEAKAIKDRHDNALAELEKPCSECGKPHGPDEVETLRGHLAAKVREKVREAQYAKGVLATLVESLEAAKRSQEALCAAIPDVERAATRLEHISKWIVEVNSVKAKARELLAERDRSLAAALAEASAPNPHQALVEHLALAVSGGEAKAGELASKVRALDDEVAVREAVAKTFGPAGVRAHILDTVTPFLNARTADYLAALSDGHIRAVWTTLTRAKSGDLKEKFSIDVENALGARSFKGLSGGEKRKVRLACVLALQDLVASRASKPFSLWIGDEIDDALDDAGLERLMAILEQKARERGTVLIISHNSLTDWADAVTTVTKKDGSSTVSGALCAAS
jgi:DNA repair exonuclease SbcCD ATPase subunit